jgi:hypothetical protein
METESFFRTEIYAYFLKEAGSSERRKRLDW